ncbi:MAG: hypothetical protein U0802_23495 [Candidatus Binatia bacterium]
MPPGSRTFAYQWAEFALPLFGDADGGGFLFAPHRPPVASPLLLTAPDGRTLLLAPLDHFHAQIVALPRDADAVADGLRCGWHGDLAEAPAEFATELALWAAPTPRAALDAWAALLRRRAGTTRPRAMPTPAWRACRTGPTTAPPTTTAPRPAGLRRHARACRDRLRGARDSHRAGPDRLLVLPARAAAAGERGGRADRAAQRHAALGTARGSLPQGFSPLREQLGHRPLAFHSRHFASASPYFARHAAWTDGVLAHPSGPELFDHLLGAAAAWGAVTYEQDWLVESFFGVRGLRARRSAPDSGRKRSTAPPRRTA